MRGGVCYHKIGQTRKHNLKGMEQGKDPLDEKGMNYLKAIALLDVLQMLQRSLPFCLVKIVDVSKRFKGGGKKPRQKGGVEGEGASSSSPPPPGVITFLNPDPMDIEAPPDSIEVINFLSGLGLDQDLAKQTVWMQVSKEIGEYGAYMSENSPVHDFFMNMQGTAAQARPCKLLRMFDIYSCVLNDNGEGTPKSNFIKYLIWRLRPSESEKLPQYKKGLLLTLLVHLFFPKEIVNIILSSTPPLSTKTFSDFACSIIKATEVDTEDSEVQSHGENLVKHIMEIDVDRLAPLAEIPGADRVVRDAKLFLLLRSYKIKTPGFVGQIPNMSIRYPPPLTLPSEEELKKRVDYFSRNLNASDIKETVKRDHDFLSKNAANILNALDPKTQQKIIEEMMCVLVCLHMTALKHNKVTIYHDTYYGEDYDHHKMESSVVFTRTTTSISVRYVPCVYKLAPYAFAYAYFGSTESDIRDKALAIINKHLPSDSTYEVNATGQVAVLEVGGGQVVDTPMTTIITLPETIIEKRLLEPKLKIEGYHEIEETVQVKNNMVAETYLGCFQVIQKLKQRLSDANGYVLDEEKVYENVAVAGKEVERIVVPRYFGHKFVVKHDNICLPPLSEYAKVSIAHIIHRLHKVNIPFDPNFDISVKFARYVFSPDRNQPDARRSYTEDDSAFTVNQLLLDSWKQFCTMFMGGYVPDARYMADNQSNVRMFYYIKDEDGQSQNVSQGGGRKVSYIVLKSDIKKHGIEKAKRRRVYKSKDTTKSKYINYRKQRVFLSAIKGKYIVIEK